MLFHRAVPLGCGGATFANYFHVEFQSALYLTQVLPFTALRLILRIITIVFPGQRQRSSIRGICLFSSLLCW